MANIQKPESAQYLYLVSFKELLNEAIAREIFLGEEILQAISIFFKHGMKDESIKNIYAECLGKFLR